MVGVSRNGGLSKCTGDPQACLSDSSKVFTPPQPGSTPNLATVKADLATKGLVWTSLFGDA
jgi:hypothetical protein